MLKDELEPGEVMLEACFAQLTAPGMLLLTDRRLLWAGKGVVFRRRPSRVFIPRGLILELTLIPGRFDSELHVATPGGTFRFFSVDPDQAERLIAAHRGEAVVKTGRELLTDDPGPRLKFAPLLVMVIGVAIAIRWPIVGLVLVAAGIAYYFLRREHHRRLPH